VALLERIAAGDSAAVEACLDKYGGLVWSLALRMSRSKEDAEDAVQEIFISLWKSAARFDASRATETAFIAMIARRRLIDRRRASGRTKEDATPSVDLEAVMSFDHERMHSCVEAQAAARVLESLPAERGMVLRLAIFDGLSHAQIAEATKLPLGTVKSHVKRGLASVREKLCVEESVGEVTQQ
jgi:RNA polymerase sigma-70 factor (ECF subfamily)